MKNIISVSSLFPNPKFIEYGQFVLNNTLEMERQGASVDVIVPTSLKQEIVNYFNDKKYINTGKLNIIRPRVFKFSERSNFLAKYFTSELNTRIISNGLEKYIKYNYNKKYSFCYTQFLTAARWSIPIVSKFKIPIFADLGESRIEIYEKKWGLEKTIDILDKCTGLLVPGKPNIDYLLSLNSAYKDKILYLPNGIDRSKFYPMNQAKCRKEIGLPQHEKIVIFCGHFIDRKGPLRVLRAIEKLNNVKGIFLGGNGPQKPVGNSVLYRGSIPNSEIPLWLNSADVFVLPSLNEGMANAILEAASCGLPLVVSNKDFNTSFLPSSTAIFVDPLNTDTISSGIYKALEVKTNYHMRQASEKIAEKYSIENRIKKMFNFVYQMTN